MSDINDNKKFRKNIKPIVVNKVDKVVPATFF